MSWDDLRPEAGRLAESHGHLRQAVFHGAHAAEMGYKAGAKARVDGTGRTSIPLPTLLEAAIAEGTPEDVSTLIRDKFPGWRADAIAHAGGTRDAAFMVHLNTMLTLDQPTRPGPACEPAVEGSWTEGMDEAA